MPEFPHTPAGFAPFAESSALLDDPAGLRQRAESDGYLFFRGLIEPDALMQVRRDFVDILDRHGWLAPGSDPMDARTAREPVVEGEEDYWPVLDEFQKLESFHSLPHHPAIYRVLEAVLGETVLAHPRNIGRIIFPGAPKTPPHQDYFHIGGTPETWTAWIPLGAVDEPLGPLATLSGSRSLGLLPTHPAPGAGGAAIDTGPLPGTWVSQPFEPGDVLLVHSLSIHAGTPNLTGERIRLSCDFRYQGVSDPVRPDSLEPHFGRLSWDEIYAGWKSTRYQYYWKQLPLTLGEPVQG